LSLRAVRSPRRRGHRKHRRSVALVRIGPRLGRHLGEHRGIRRTRRDRQTHVAEGVRSVAGRADRLDRASTGATAVRRPMGRRGDHRTRRLRPGLSIRGDRRGRLRSLCRIRTIRHFRPRDAGRESRRQDSAGKSPGRCARRAVRPIRCRNMESNRRDGLLRPLERPEALLTKSPSLDRREGRRDVVRQNGFQVGSGVNFR
jgi:hypothetical protein